MILVEDGKVALDDPVDRWLPELANRKVLRSLASSLDDTVPARRAITVRDLVTLRLGIGAVMEEPGKYPIQKAMADAELAPSENLFRHSPDEFMKRLGGLPLIHQPGENWMYHTGFDVLGVLIARAAEMSFGDFLEQRIFAPLEMQDTGFSVPQAKLGRFATCYRADPPSGKLVVWDEARGGRWSRPPVFEAGGGGLVSTADDYFAFARMMLDHGMRDQHVILAPHSVEAMITDQITPAQKAASTFYPGFWDTRSWGFGLSMTTAPDDIAKVPGRYGWDGGYGTTYVADPHEDMVAILLTQRVMQGPDDSAINQEFLKLAYRAVI
jgi:CubicO group peptidase (beta-lactamase class C family)